MTTATGIEQTPEKVGGRYGKILVVDDKPENLFAMVQMLKALKVEITTAQSGSEALSYMLRDDFAVILLDVQMPQMDGFETANLMQANERTKHIPIIFVTAVSKEKVFVFKGYEAGAVDYLFKPVETEILVNKVQVFIQMHEEKLKLSREMEARKKAQWEAAEARQRLEQFFEAVPVGLFAVDEKGRPSYANQASKDLLGPEILETGGKGLSGKHRTFVAETGTPYPEKKLPIPRALKGEKVFVSDMEIEREGRRISLEVWATPIYDEKGKVNSAIAAFVDYTERKSLESQLQQAHKMEAIGRLAGGVAHDLNNMLMVISGYAALQKDMLSENREGLESTEEIINATRRASQVTHQLLAFSRRQILKPVVLNVNGLVGEMEKMLHRLIEENIEFIIELEPKLPKVEVDPSQFQQIIMNLAINARDAMPGGGKLILKTAAVEIKTENTHKEEKLPPGHYVELSVSDTGTGMDKETLSQIFEPFFTTKESGKGTGLGLATVYGIVKQSKGFVSVYSEPDKGTTFRILFPVTSKTGKPETEERSQPKETSGTETILLVEDELSVLELVTTYLKSRGYQVIPKNSPHEALQHLQSSETIPHLLVTDVVMPGMSGKELAENVQEKNSGIKVLFMSGHDEEIIAHHGILDQDTKLILKPFNLEDLAEQIRALLDD